MTKIRSTDDSEIDDRRPVVPIGSGNKGRGLRPQGTSVATRLRKGSTDNAMGTMALAYTRQRKRAKGVS